MTNLALTVKLKRGNFSLLVEENIPLENVTALFGESGSGKTTLLRIIAGLEKKAWGKVALGKTYWQNDETKTFLPPHKRSIGYVFQDNRLFNHLNVEGNLRFGHDRSDAKNGVQFNDVVDALDLSNLLLRTPHSLSGGEKQLVSIGRALLSDPELLLMDEPLSALDAKRKAEVIPYIEQLPSNFSIPVLYVTHNLEEVTRLAPNMLLISEGKIAGKGKVEKLLERIDLWSVTERLAAGSVLNAEVKTHLSDWGMTILTVAGHELRIPAISTPLGTFVRLRVQAKDVALATQKPVGLSIRNILSAQILSIDIEEDIFAEVLLDIGGANLRARVTREAVDDLKLATGQKIYALIKSAALEEQLFTK